MLLGPGTKLGRYEIRSKLGEGGMGEVYLAQDTKLDRKVALKILPPAVASKRDRMTRFFREAKTAAALNHPNIAHIYEIGESDDMHFIAMEFIEGETLRDLIHDRRSELAKLLRYLQHAAEGLAKAHAAGIVHRDLKPDNIMVTRDGHPKILDFGLAKLIEPVGPLGSSGSVASDVATAIQQSHSTPGTVLGTVGYMSPEQAQGKTDEIDHRSDIFSFGCILFEAATGRRAFEGREPIERLHKIVHAPSPEVRDFNPSAPDDLQRVVRRCLQKDPDRRYQAIKDVAIELEELLEQLKDRAPSRADATSANAFAPTAAGSIAESAGATVSEAPRSTISREQIFVEIKRHKKAVLAALAALVVAVAGLAYGLYRLLNRGAAGQKAMKIVQLTNSGKVGPASISADGKYVAYVTFDEAGQQSLWVKHVATGGNAQIVAPSGADVSFDAPVFTPDGNYVYYLRVERGGSAALFQVPVVGGTSKKMLENVRAGVSFSPDGKRLAFPRRNPSQGEDALMLANADGTGEQKLAARKLPDFFIPGLAWSPDGTTIACPIGGFASGYYRTLAAINVADGTLKRITSQGWTAIDRVVWLSDGSGLMITAQEQTAMPWHIWHVSYPDGEVRPVTSDLSIYRYVSITADSETLAAVLVDITANISVVPFGAWNDIRQITTGKNNGGSEGRVTWTPDGRIVYGSRAGGNPDIWIMDAEGRNQRQITDDPESERAFSVTPDGRYLVFDSNRAGTTQIRRVDIDGANPRTLTSGSGATQTSVSPDGKWVYYTGFGANGWYIGRVSIDGGEPERMTTRNSLVPSVSPDGKLVACYYYADPASGLKLALIPFDGGDPVRVFEIPPTANRSQPVRWTPDGRALVYILTRGVVSNIWAQPVDGGPPKQLTDFKTDTILSFDFSRDGKWLALSRGTTDADVVLIKDFR